ncbi:MAG TPA: phospho-N-acetylmuramoyl-pentapeptide-transferase [Candidatus Agrococcus pullicola]|uniref:Phospho-N-acetylmuramoyl-pentapeptide-transferase n=1 Tax=Candidatus Agrococcus pullicola TaxID=2838429 RepID=A0A9D1YWS0_9MICO|nr:phospho-N-acetylmuramoyl-pentapeptide-transferase [Candidatus Agrococcus pullicola]
MYVLIFSAFLAFLISIVATPLAIRLFRRIGWGQFVREDGPDSHHTKRGTPTMGGIVFTLATVLGYTIGKLVAWNPPSLSALLILGLMVGIAFIGFLDDFTKISNQRSLGLTGWAKIAGQVIVGTVFAVLALFLRDSEGRTPVSLAISGVRDIPWLDLAQFGIIAGTILFVLWVLFMIVATSNAVNVTDGLDGLATGASIIAFSAYVFIGFWQFNQSCLQYGGGGAVNEDMYRCYDVSAPLDIAIVASCIVGALIGFLWYNTTPARIFMGDVGSLGLGGALAGMAILTHTELLLILVAGLPLIVTGSVIVQRVYFKLTKGKRIFLMSPIHHHFELKGWAEVTIVVRFWIIAGLCVAAAVGLFYLEWVTHPSG